jgi:hypothetical protein
MPGESFPEIGHLKYNQQVYELLPMMEIGCVNMSHLRIISLKFIKHLSKHFQHKTPISPQIPASSWRKKENTYEMCP